MLGKKMWKIKIILALGSTDFILRYFTTIAKTTKRFLKYNILFQCTRCLQEISFKTDPKNCDYEIEAGATRNFMALKLAEEQAQREEDELRKEEANNPMKLLENRTIQSKNEIELLESLEELRDLNKRQQAVDFDSMLQQYDTRLSAQELEEKLKQRDEEYIK